MRLLPSCSLQVSVHDDLTGDPLTHSQSTSGFNTCQPARDEIQYLALARCQARPPYPRRPCVFFRLCHLYGLVTHTRISTLPAVAFTTLSPVAMNRASTLRAAFVLDLNMSES